MGECGEPFVVYFFVRLCMVLKGLKGEKGDTGRGSMDGMDTSGFPAGFVEGPQGPPGRQVSSMLIRKPMACCCARADCCLIDC